MKNPRDIFVECALDLKEQGIIEILEKSLDRDIAKTKWVLTPFGRWFMEKMGLEFENFARIIDDKAQMRKLREEYESGVGVTGKN